MRTLVRHLVRSARRWNGTGAVRNARLELEASTRSVADLERRLAEVCRDPSPRAA